MALEELLRKKKAAISEPLTLDIVPNYRVGPFVIGSSLRTVTVYLRGNVDAYPSVDLLYDAEAPLTRDIVLNLPNNGIQLRFDPVAQQLKTIDVIDPTCINLRYQNVSLAPFSFAHLYDQVFMPTNGEYKPSRKSYLLNYPGLTLFFPCAGLEKYFPDGRIQLDKQSNVPVPVSMSHLSVYCGTYTQRTPLASIAHSTLPVSGPAYGDKVIVLKGHGLQFERTQQTIAFGMSCQDIVSLLGGPSGVFYKPPGDKMKIHATAESKSSSTSNDYFYNYYEFGLDVLFDGVSHSAKKIVLHTNVPGHYDFDCYNKCFFEIHLETSTVPPLGQIHDSDPVKKSKKKNGGGNGNGGGAGASLDTPSIDRTSPVGEPGTGGSTFCVNPDSLWDDIQARLRSPFKAPVAVNRSTATNTTNPFGPTLFFGYQELIFEVIPTQQGSRFGHLSSVTIFPAAASMNTTS